MSKNKFYKVALPSYLLLVVLPCLFGLLVCFYLIKTDNNLKIEQIKGHLSHKATEFLAKINAVDYYKSHLQNLANKLLPFSEIKKTKSNLNTKAITEVIDDQNKNLDENFRCAIFDKDGNLLNPSNLVDYEQRFFTYTWKRLNGLNEEEYKEKWKDQFQILGREFSFKAARGHTEYFLQISSVGKKGIFYYKKPANNTNGIIIYLEYKKSNFDFVEAKVKALSDYDSPIILYDLKSQKPVTSFCGHNEIPYEKTNTDDFFYGFIEGNFIWKGFAYDNFKILLGYNLKDKNNYIEIIIAIVLFGVVISFSTLFFYKNITNIDGIFISIKYKLVFIFVLAIYMPTLSLWVLSHTSLSDIRLSIENNIKRNIIDTLNKIDFGYKKNEEDIKKGYIKLDNYLKEFKNGYFPTDSEVKQKLQEIVGENVRISYQFNWLDIRDINQKQLFVSDEKKKNTNTLARVFFISAFAKHCPERFNSSGFKPNPRDAMISSIFENPLVGFSTVFERPKELLPLNFEGDGIYFWWNYYSDKNNTVAYYIANSTTRFIRNKYLNSIISHRYNIDNINLKLAYFVYESQEFIPESFIGSKPIFDLINASNVNKTVESANVKYEDKDYLCLCYPGSNLKNCFILSFYPISEIDYRIDVFSSEINKLILLLFIASILTGSLLSKNFIIPIQKLNNGLEALGRREAKIKVFIDNKDELGRLGETFNQMTSNIEDMLMAASVQQCIIPSGKHEIEGYDCFVYNKMSEDVGGDYADVFELPEDRILVVIGDVIGHGVASSLLTAMVKASIFRSAIKNTNLSEIVTNTSDMICELLNQKKIMTFCAITLDKKTGELFICNAGHPYPIIKEVEIGSCRFIKQNTLPMGLPKNQCRYTALSEKLEVGETLLLYTDGFFKAKNLDGVEFGYDNFNEFIANANINSAEDLKKQLVNKLEKHHGEKALAEDVTFIILRRKPLQYN